MKALSSIRVLDFSWGLAGPTITELLAIAGAQVIKIESMKRLDPNRTDRDPVKGDPPTINQSDIFNDLNIGKLSLRLNVRSEKGLQLAKSLVKISDVMIDNFAAGVMDRIGLGYDVVREINPQIVMFSSSTSGSSGPERDAVGWAPLFGALSGISDMTGYPDMPPTEIRYSMDMISGYTGLVSIMAALHYRQRTGRGQYIDFSSRESISCLLGDSFMDYILNGRIQTRSANLDDIMAPHNCYRCRGNDRWVSIAIATEEEWRAFSKAIGNPDWVKDERFADQYSRWQNQEELDRLVESWTINHSSYEVMDVLQKAGVAAVACFTPEELFSDPHLGERKVYTVIEHPEAGTRFYLDFPWKLSLTPCEITRDAPLFGEHTEYILSELLGLSRDEIQELAEQGVLY